MGALNLSSNELIKLSTQQQEKIRDALYEFVVRTASNSEKASPAEVKILPEMSKLLVWYWPTLES